MTLLAIPLALATPCGCTVTPCPAQQPLQFNGCWTLVPVSGGKPFRWCPHAMLSAVEQTGASHDVDDRVVQGKDTHGRAGLQPKRRKSPLWHTSQCCCSWANPWRSVQRDVPDSTKALYYVLTPVSIVLLALAAGSSSGSAVSLLPSNRVPHLPCRAVLSPCAPMIVRPCDAVSLCCRARGLCTWQ